ncbi:hypothetical protein Tco_0774654 [Tanacetum coccineum]|uniref:Uncharacterized protein n=1 Tax=Tanacetum coccineum TaxID=301880 RepID=A0ABQ4ZTD2_9ASTR
MSHKVQQHRTSTDSVVNQIRCTPMSQESTQWLDHMIKEQLRDEKFKANEDAEDLITRNGRVKRYQLTGLLEEEYKKRTCIEKRALQRITELESQIKKERSKTFTNGRGLPNA